MFYVYILFNKSSDRYYIGQTNNLDSRILRHNQGYVKSTKHGKPWELVYFETHESRKESMNREAYKISKVKDLFGKTDKGVQL